MRKFLLPFIGASMLIGSTAIANCWDECVLPNPISGGCGKSVKVCDVEDPGRAIASLGTDVKAAENCIVASWHAGWGEVPGPIRDVLEHHPISIIASIFPATQPYVLAIAAAEEYASRSIRHGEEIHQIVQQAPEWKKTIGIEGVATLMVLEGIDVSNSPYLDNLPPNLNKYDAPWEHFKSCLVGAQDSTAGKACLNVLAKEAYAIKYGL